MVPYPELHKRQAMQRLRQQLAQSDEAFQRVLRLATHSLDSAGAVLAMVGLERHYFRARQGVSVAETPYNIAFFAQAMAGDGLLIVPDLALDERFCDHALVTDAPALRFYAGATVRDPDGLSVGALCAVDPRPRQLSQEAAESLAGVLADLAGLVEQELLMRSLTRTDPLTGLHNASYAQVDVEREWNRARRGHYPVTVLMVDLDRLGEYNDVFGYPAGDRALREVAERLNLRFRRSSDLLIRMGGDRLLILLPDTDAEDGLRLAQSVRAEVEALALGNRETGTCLTLSIGCATASRDSGYAHGYPQLIRQADAALREAKIAGGNRVRLHASGQAPGLDPA